MRVIIAEKPSVAKSIARIVGANKQETGYYTGGEIIVTYAFGHLVTEADPEEMNPAWKDRFDPTQLPMIPTTWRYVPNPSAVKQYEIIRALFTAPTTTEIINATDAAREGEAIFRRIYALTGATAPVYRLWTSSLTDEALSNALRSLKPGSAYDALGAAARARSQVDWLIGMNYSRAYTCINRKGCSIGRVMTPTLAMIVDRHKAIADFVKTPYYEIAATHEGFSSLALNPGGKTDFEDKQLAQQILGLVPPGTRGTVLALDQKTEREQSPKLHNLGELQKEANERYGYTADAVLELAQALYEKKYLTYPRSSSRYLSEDMVSHLPAVLRAVQLDGEYASLLLASRQEAARNPHPGKRYVDDAKLSDHHAIIPTQLIPSNLSTDELRIYQLVAARFIGMWLPEKITSVTRAEIQFTGHIFRAVGRQIVQIGWSQLVPKKDTKKQGEPQILPALTVGQSLTIAESKLLSKKRTPPDLFTDATLLAAMETAGKTIEDEALREAMKGKGLGTEATRAETIKKLEAKQYIQRAGKHIVPTDFACQLIAQLRSSLPTLANPEATAQLEEQLALIESGRVQDSALIDSISKFLVAGIPKALEAPPLSRSDTRVVPLAPKGAIPCPVCAEAGKTSFLREIKDTPRLGCVRFPDCRFQMFREISGRKMTDAELKKLCATGKTGTLEGFHSTRTGRLYSSTLALNKATGWKPAFVFNTK